MRKSLVGYQHRLRSPQVFPIDGANFDGTNDFQVHAGTLAGAAISKLGIASLWFRLNGGDGAQQCFFATSTGTRLFIQRSPSNTIVISAKNGAGTTIMTMDTTATFLAGGGWKHLLATWDLSIGAVASGIWIQDVKQALGSPVWTNDDIGYTDGGSPSIGALSSGVSKCNADLADVYVAYGQWLDFNIYINRRRYISSVPGPVKLGGTGSDATGLAPSVFCRLADNEAPANFGLNRGTGGDFTITGALTTSTTSPSDLG